MRLKQILAFLFVGSAWGSSFFWIKICLEEIGPYALVAWRLLFAAIGLVLVMRMKKAKFPRDLETWSKLTVLSLLTPAIPFVLISWGETRIDSSLAAVLNAAIPLFVTVFSHLFLPDDKMTPERTFGLILGFMGIFVLFSRDLTAQAFHGNLLGQLAIVGSTALYACHSVYSRRNLRNFNPIVLSTAIMALGDVFVWLSVPVLETQALMPHRMITWFALLWMGLLGTCGAFICFYYLMNSWGPTRASLVNYITPVVGLVLGLVFLGEKADWRLFVGSALVLFGIIVVNWKALKKLAKT